MPACLLALLSLPLCVHAQNANANPLEKQGQRSVEGAQPAPQSGVSTGGAHPAVLDAEHRPITAGGFVTSGPVIFQDVAKAAGLTSWTHHMGSPEKNFILETVGSGVALLDYDNDGWLDIYLVNGSSVEAENGHTQPGHAALFHNNHDGTFTDIAAKAGVTNDRWGFGAVVGDYDNDGWPDLYVTNYGKNRLFHNNHDGTFTDIAEKAGVTVGGWSTGATWGDYDGDGLLDLFVPGYVHVDQLPAAGAQLPAAGAQLPVAGAQSSSTSALAFCEFRGVKVMCGPHGLRGEPDHLFRNNGDGTFTDVSQHTGVGDANHYYGLSSLFIDLNGDGKPDLLVADDSTPNYLYVNKGHGTFEDDSFASGFALNESGRETASMGIGAGDLTHDGRVDLYTTTFSDDYNPLYRNDGDANFTDIAYQAGIAEITYPFLGWGTTFLDFDNDGWLDIFVANGHVYPQVDAQNWGTTYAQRPLLFHSDKGKLTLVPAVENTGLAKLATSRGVASGDLFNDGHLDIVVNNMDGTPSLFRNVVKTENHWIGFHLVGAPSMEPGKSGSPRDAIGATVWVTAEGFRQRADVIAGGSFASSPDPRIHFGVGTAKGIEKIEVRWPSSRQETVAVPARLDTLYTLTEGQGLSPYAISAAAAVGRKQ